MDKEVTLEENREKKRSPKVGTFTFLKYIIMLIHYSFIIHWIIFSDIHHSIFFRARHISILGLTPPLISWEALCQRPMVFFWGGGFFIPIYDMGRSASHGCYEVIANSVHEVPIPTFPLSCLSVGGALRQALMNRARRGP